jgi:FdhD protein
LDPGVAFDPKRLERHFFSTSACGVCGKAALETIRVHAEPLRSDFQITAAQLYSLDEKLRKAQPVFDRTGALHAAALFDATGNLALLREDVGRHNAVDKVVGAALLAGKLPLERHILMVSGRSSFEIMQKALTARIPIVASVGGPSSLAIDVAEEFGVTLVSFLRGRRCNVYAGKQRVKVEE